MFADLEPFVPYLNLEREKTSHALVVFNPFFHKTFLYSVILYRYCLIGTAYKQMNTGTGTV